MKIFISHSQKDVDIATKIKELFEDYGENRMDVFSSSKLNNDQQKFDDWKKNFEDNLRGSSHCVVLVTPNSLNSQWVHYETGFASATKDLEIIPVGIKGVSPENSLWQHTIFENVDDVDGVVKLLSRIYHDQKKGIRSYCVNDGKELVNKLIDLCKERCIYFVGSKPENKSDERGWKQEFVDDFIDSLTPRLLQKGAKISSFPTVHEVGERVFDATMKKNPEKYEISGLYGCDRAADKKDIDKCKWDELLKNSRKTYLENKNSMIIIGGNEHTREEFYVAKDMPTLEIFPIPCMGGFAEEQFNYDKERYKKTDHPCCGCNYKERKGNCDRIDIFFERLSKYIYIDEG